MPDLLLVNGRVTTLNPANPEADAVAIADGRILAVGRRQDLAVTTGPETRVIDLGGRRVIPGLNDSHTHLIRGGLNYNMELRWEGIESVHDALALLKAQARVTPAPQWVRVVGSFTMYQFREKRLPMLDEINAAAPDTPVFILHLYDRALLNRAALRAVGYTRDTPEPPGGEIQRDAHGEPTGLLLAKPNAAILYATLARGPKLEPEDQINSTRQFMRELNRLGVTSVIDAGGGFQNYPDDYAIIRRLAENDQLTLRIAYNLFTQRPGAETEDFVNWAAQVTPGDGGDWFRHNGAGEMLVFSAADFEDFFMPRPELPSEMEGQLEQVVRVLVANRWPFRLHATYDESIGRALDVFERVNREIPFDGLHWFFDHAETVTPRNLERIAALGGGIAVQHRMAFQGEAFVDRYGARAAEATPPVRRMLDMGLPVGGGTDATRVASYNPWTALAWLIGGRTVGGLQLYPPSTRPSRLEALRMWTEGSAWFSTEAGKKGRIQAGQFADLAVLSEDLMTVADEAIAGIESLLTIVGGRIVHGAGPFDRLAPPPLPVSPDWAPTRRYALDQMKQRKAAMAAEGIDRSVAAAGSCCAGACGIHGHAHARPRAASLPVQDGDLAGFWGAVGCGCWAV
ncbi:amidohydrolase 3 (plasmid) [Tistrella mobilis KA081020-065]|uniref:Amidohydrolase 3 n=2 Tax=Tistrella mobilis TaxID=171437 RepID=I3TVZ5_TISMK|nr:amidohydrolase 3 [Tistrella mobilis KA081020-065]